VGSVSVSRRWALGAGPAAFAGGRAARFLDAGEGAEQVADAHREAGLGGVAAHEVGDGEGEHAGEDVDADLGLGPVEHRGEPDEVGVFELAEAGLDVALGAVGGGDGDRPVVAVGDQGPFAEDLGFQGVLGGGVDGEAQPYPGRSVAGQLGGWDPGQSAGPGDPADLGLDLVAVAAGPAAVEGGGELGEGTGGCAHGWAKPQASASCRAGEWVSTTRRSTPNTVVRASTAFS
jgi:hypothetical protein